jgi:O-acetyl-ADP-ribose deacetylase
MIELVQADITTLDVDAIVNAANSSLAGGGGVDGAIHRAAGPELAKAATRLAPCPPGHAVLTPGFRLRARYVIHTVGPIWAGGTAGEPDVLRAAYESSFEVARSAPAIRSIAFPAISTGVYMFPKELAAEIAVEVMGQYLDDFDRVVACVFGDDNLEAYERALART